MDQEKAISIGSAKDSRILADHGSTSISIREEDEDIELKTKGLALKVEEEKKLASSCVIDVNVNKEDEDEDEDGEKVVCRVCHISSSVAAWGDCKSSADLIQIGCGCKGELGVAHSHCAETWFKVKGNRICEICGENAKHITGIVDNKFMEEWNENRLVNTDSVGSLETSRGCWQGQPLCNFLMACLVIAFVLPWFFRVNMF